MAADQQSEDALLQDRLDLALAQHLPALTADLDPADLEDARQAYARAFELLLYDHWGDSAAFERAVSQGVEAARAGGAATTRDVLRDYRMVAELVSMDRKLEDLAVRIHRKEAELTPELRQMVEGFRKRLLEIGAEMDAERPHLRDHTGLLPQPRFRVTTPAVVCAALSESLLDSNFILGQARGGAMSLRLAEAISPRPAVPLAPARPRLRDRFQRWFGRRG